MILWIAAVVLFAFLSYLIDLNYLPLHIFRYIWDSLILGLGLYLLVRIRMKSMEGVLERMQNEYRDLTMQIEKKRHENLKSEIEKLRNRLSQLEVKE